MSSREEQELPDADVILAARAGDPQAIEQLVRTYLPLVYNIVGRASEASLDVDAVARVTMREALAGLPTLREPAHFRSWLFSIAVRKVRAARHSRPLAGDSPDFADVTISRLALTGQRAEAVAATRLLAADDRALLSLWWLEVAGKITRAELEAAFALTPADAAVRVREVEGLLEQARARVRPVTDLIPADRLLRGFALVPLPAGLSDQLLTPPPPRTRTARAAHSLGRLSARPLTSPPLLVSALVAAALIGGAGWYAYARPAQPMNSAVVRELPSASASPSVTRPATPSPTPSASASPPPAKKTKPVVATKPAKKATTGTLLGHHSLRAFTYAGSYFIRADDGLAFLDSVSANSDRSDRRDATFKIVPGLADSECYSFRDHSGRYLRHYAFRVHLDANNGTEIFKQDTTFCVQHGLAGGTIMLRSYNYPGRFLRYRNNAEIWIDPLENTAAYRTSASFFVTSPLD